MISRELVVFGTAGERPNRYRSAGGYLLHWGDCGILFDPGEGTQRQMSLCDVTSAAITHICISHFHPDHCLGLPGLLDRFRTDGVARPIEILYPAAGQRTFDNLLYCATDGQPLPFVVPVPIAAPAQTMRTGDLIVETECLDHTVETLGYRVSGPDAVFSFIMDTRPCDAAIRLCRDSDLMLCQSTFLDAQKSQAVAGQYMTAAEAAGVAAAANAKHLLLTHFSHRYDEVNAFVHEARPVFSAVDSARDCSRYAFQTVHSTA